MFIYYFISSSPGSIEKKKSPTKWVEQRFCVTIVFDLFWICWNSRQNTLHSKAFIPEWNTNVNHVFFLLSRIHALNFDRHAFNWIKKSNVNLNVIFNIAEKNANDLDLIVNENAWRIIRPIAMTLIENFATAKDTHTHEKPHIQKFLWIWIRCVSSMHMH